MARSTLIARHFETAGWIEVAIAGDRIAAVGPIDGPGIVAAADDWIAPAFWDLQVNGRLGWSFSGPELTVAAVAAVVEGQGAPGTARSCPTLITGPPGDLLHGVRTIARACDEVAGVEARVLGIHLEGPFLSGLEGYRGAHPAAWIRDPDWGEFARLQDASGGRVAIVTLAPERPGSIAFIRKAVEAGVVVALGHTAADGDRIRAAVDAGATLSTHLGNGVAATLARHPNPIWDQASEDRLFASLIADGHHLGPSILRALVRAKTPGRILLVGDASPLAGLPVGTYGPWAVDPSGKVVVAGTPYLAGSNRGLTWGVNALIRDAGLAPAEAIGAATAQPARVLGRSAPTIAPGQPADLIRFRLPGRGDRTRFELRATCVGGAWVDPDPAGPP